MHPYIQIRAYHVKDPYVRLGMYVYVCVRPYVYATYIVLCLPNHVPPHIRGYAPDLTCPPACPPACLPTCIQDLSALSLLI